MRSLQLLLRTYIDSGLRELALGNVASARDQYQQALAVVPDHPAALHLLGTALLQLGQTEQAVDRLGSVLHALFRFEEAEREYRACIAMAPDYLAAQFNLASVLIDVGRFPEAETVCRRLISRIPADVCAHTLLAAALGHQGRLREAQQCHCAAAELAPNDAKVAENHAAALANIGEFRRALKEFSRACNLDPDLTSAHQSLGTALLAQGCFTDGWAEYAYRPAFIRFREQNSEVRVSRTLPTELDGEPIFLVGEQGLGALAACRT